MKFILVSAVTLTLSMASASVFSDAFAAGKAQTSRFSISQILTCEKCKGAAPLIAKGFDQNSKSLPASAQGLIKEFNSAYDTMQLYCKFGGDKCDMVKNGINSLKKGNLSADALCKDIGVC